MRFPCLVGVVLGAALSLRSAPSPAAPGDLDSTFNGTGLARYAFGPDLDRGQGVVAQTDGKLVVAGKTRERGVDKFAVARYLTDGSLDTSFGDGGHVVFHMGELSSGAQDVRVQSDGKIVVAGWSYDFSYHYKFAVLRLNADGSVDNTFGSGGKVLTVIGGFWDIGYCTRVQSDGKIVVAGSSRPNLNSTNYDMSIIRLNTNGTLDTSFDGDGIKTIDLHAKRDQIFGMTIQSDGKLLFVGTEQEVNFAQLLAVVRLNTNGSFDTSFSGDGIATMSILGNGDYGLSVVYSPASQFLVASIAVAGEAYDGSTYHVAVGRFNVDGSIDTSFNGTGHVVTVVGQRSTGEDLIVHSSVLERKYAVAGWAKMNSSQSDFLILRYLGNGALDTSFNGSGSELRYVGGTVDAGAYGFVYQSPNYTLAGTGTPSSDLDFTMVRLSSAGVLDTSFGVGGIAMDNLGTMGASAHDVAVQPDGKLLAVGTRTDNLGVVVRYNADGTPDSSFGVQGSSPFTVPSGLFSEGRILIRSDASLLVTGNTYYSQWAEFCFTRMDPNGVDLGTVTAAPADFNHCVGAAILSDGKILLAGNSHTIPSNWTGFSMARFLANGTPDLTFGGGTGTRLMQIPGSTDAVAYAMVVQPDDRLIIAGESSDGVGNTELTVARFLVDGSFDNSFSGNAWDRLVIAGTSSARAMRLQDDGKVVIAGEWHDAQDDDYLVVRYNPDGTRDGSFGTGGILTTDFPGFVPDYANAVCIQDDGRILVSGHSETGGKDNVFSAARYNADGTTDASFGTQGLVTVEFPGTDADLAWGMALDGEGRPVLAGDSDALFGLARLETDPPAATGVPDEPGASAVLRVGPNPFRSAAGIHYRLSRDGDVALRVFAADGALVATLADGPQAAGEHDAAWAGRDDRGVELPAGVYFLRLDAEGRTLTRRITRIR